VAGKDPVRQAPPARASTHGTADRAVPSMPRPTASAPTGRRRRTGPPPGTTSRQTARRLPTARCRRPPGRPSTRCAFWPTVRRGRAPGWACNACGSTGGGRVATVLGVQTGAAPSGPAGHLPRRRFAPGWEERGPPVSPPGGGRAGEAGRGGGWSRRSRPPALRATSRKVASLLGEETAPSGPAGRFPQCRFAPRNLAPSGRASSRVPPDVCCAVCQPCGPRSI
jgi:hypothetical protein